MAFKKELANNERFYKEADDLLQLDTSVTAYEVFIETRRDKEGNTIMNKDGSERYFPVEEDKITSLEEDRELKKVREGVYKPIYKIEEDIVERVERDGKRSYFVVDPSKVEVVKKGTKVIISKSGLVRLVDQVGMVIVDDTDLENERVISVRPFKTEDHKKEAEDTLKNLNYRHHRK